MSLYRYAVKTFVTTFYYVVFFLHAGVDAHSPVIVILHNLSLSENVHNDSKIKSLTFYAHQKDSCFYLCNEWRPVPCSCDVRCLVIGNCCEDFRIECPETFLKGQTRFSRFVNAEIVCKYNTFMVSKCPFDENNSSSALLHNGLEIDTSLRDANINIEVNNTFIDEVIQILPVSDMTSGFTYVNSDVYKCFAESNSEPLFWDIVLQSDDSIFSMRDKLLNATILHSRNISFIPTTLLKERMMLPICFQNSISECPADRSQDPWIQNKCSSLLSFVDVQTTVFTNRYCALCHGFNNSEPILEAKAQAYNSFIFSITMSLRNNKLIVNQVGKGSASMWQTIQCNLESNANSDFPCEVQPCHKLAYLIDGLCKHSTVLLLAFPAATFPVFEPNRILSFMQCFLYERLNTDIYESKLLPALDNFKRRKQKKYIVYTFQMFLVHDDVLSLAYANKWQEKYIEDIMSLTTSMFTMMKHLQTTKHTRNKLWNRLGTTKACFALFLEESIQLAHEIADTQLACFDVRVNTSLFSDKKELFMNISCGQHLIQSKGSVLLSVHVRTTSVIAFLTMFILNYLHK
ncbi:hypothetical protein Bpfe_004532 [Biomphalaria pfeifferi]|uniref:SMB domain-containing protein n=1 Tax=Biomphalaria pfeifferi TaxID=112525 RepID=A0AAD8FIN1_BIOPF|nr:hypothetical protein Bpfe_004532 [Biomphalaria pfeifferi]